MRFRSVAIEGERVEISDDQVKYLGHQLTKVGKRTWLLNGEEVTARNAPSTYAEVEKETELKYIYTHPITKEEKIFQLSRRIVSSDLEVLRESKKFEDCHLSLKSAKHHYSVALTYPHVKIFSIVFLDNLLVVIYKNDYYDFFLPVKDYLLEHLTTEYHKEYYLPDLLREMVTKQTKRHPSYPSLDDSVMVNVSLKDTKIQVPRQLLFRLCSSYLNDLLENLTETDDLIEFEDLTHEEFGKLFIPVWRANEAKIIKVLHRIDSIYYGWRAKNLYRLIKSYLSHDSFEVVLTFYF